MNARIPLAISFLALAAARVEAQAPPAGFSYQMIVDNAINLGASMSFAPDGRLFIAERITGNIRVLSNGVLGGNWATIPKTGTSGTEQGLLGIAVDPNFLTNKYVYVYYTRVAGITENVIARLEEVGGVGVNLTVLTPAGKIPATTIHNGGRLVFGSDGMLYAGTGDRAASATAQDKMSWNGKILRFVAPNLTAPSDNPSAVDGTFDPFVWSYGHRNQFGLTVSPVSGEIFQTENGQNTTDEINRIVKGRNYGWPQHEGPEAVPDPATFDPIATYSPTPDPTGTDFYVGNNYPAEYTNNWFFIRNYASNLLQRVVMDGAGTALVSQNQFDDLPGAGFDIASGPDGNLWYLTNDTAGQRGGDEIGRYTHINEVIPSAHLTAMCSKSVGASVTFGFTGQNGDLFFSWVGLSMFGAPVPTPYGDWWVNLDITLPISIVTGDNRVYRGVSINNDPGLIGIPIHTQAARIWGVLALAAAGCRAPSPTTEPMKSAPEVLELRWSIEPDRVTHVLRLAADGSGSLATTRIVAYEPVEDAPIALAPSAERRATVESAGAELAALPRYAHCSSTFAGVAVDLRWVEAGREWRHESFNYWHPALATWSAELARALGSPGAAALAPPLGLERYREFPRFEFTPGETPLAALLAPLSPPSPDVELRRLAARLCGELGAYELVPALQAEFDRSLARDGEGDYFLARALLELGDARGVALVAAAALSSRPSISDEASASLERRFGREIVPDWNGEGDDPREAAVVAFLRWFDASREKLAFDRERGVYIERDGATRD